MALLLVLLTTILAFSLASTDQCVSSPGSSIDLFLRSHKNASGDWIITVDTRRLTRKDNPREFSVNVQQETSICGGYEIEEHVSMAFVYPSLHDTSMSGAVQPTAASRTTTTPSSGTSQCTTTKRPNSCPQSGYEFFPEFNCYKAFPSDEERRTWSEAREQCIRDGGDLMVINSEQEKQDVYFPLFNGTFSKFGPWMGVYIPEGEEDWITVKGDPVPSTWWYPGKPSTNATQKCAYAYTEGLLRNFRCAAHQPFICEIPL